MIWGAAREPWSWHFSETNASNPTSYQVWRPEFDAILLNNARRAGVDVREGWQATGVGVRRKGGRAVAVLCHPTPSRGGFQTRPYPDGEVELPARYVVDASGQGGLLSRQLGLRQWDDFFRNLAVYGYYRGGERLPAPDDGNILIESQPGGWLWHIPLRDGWASVGAVVDRRHRTAGHPRAWPAAVPGIANRRRPAVGRDAGIRRIRVRPGGAARLVLPLPVPARPRLHPRRRRRLLH